jgi:hypothetical protein
MDHLVTILHEKLKKFPHQKFVEFCRRVSFNQVGIIRSLDLNVAYTAGPSLQSLLGNPKDKVNRNEKSGIYEINCKDCNKKQNDRS